MSDIYTQQPVVETESLTLMDLITGRNERHPRLTSLVWGVAIGLSIAVIVAYFTL